MKHINCIIFKLSLPFRKLLLGRTLSAVEDLPAIDAKLYENMVIKVRNEKDISMWGLDFTSRSLAWPGMSGEKAGAEAEFLVRSSASAEAGNVAGTGAGAGDGAGAGAGDDAGAGAGAGSGNNAVTGKKRKRPDELCPGGADMDVTEENKAEYLRLLQAALLRQYEDGIAQQTEAVRRGMALHCGGNEQVCSTKRNHFTQKLARRGRC